eukprot:TRINITY_DN15991_c0_g1_i1.p1 TRINITY_DN15991_c0_g1~~TRINITY_DN15991_c0_g1_i1.p1  ORF type:complete len:368 (+),score=70.42 TRINITY_DN15991_c0_g1_i1:110-1105(+)
MGGSMYIHAFGAYYGLVIAWVFSLKHPASKVRTNNHSIYTSDQFSMIGTIFLWMFWPSFNGALAIGGQQHRVIINTVLALCVSCTVVFCYSYLLRDSKFEIVEIQNATLAGGVAVGCSSDLVIGPWGAMLIGLVAGTISAFGFMYLTPWLEKKLGLHDTAGIHNLHGMPGILGGLGGIFSSLNAPESVYGTHIGLLFPKRAPSNVTLALLLNEIPGEDRTAETQAGFQAAALFTSVALGIIGALFATGFLLLPCISKMSEERYFLDSFYWHVPSDYPGKESTSHKDKIPNKQVTGGDSDSVEVDTPTATNLSTITTVPETLRRDDESTEAE